MADRTSSGEQPRGTGTMVAPTSGAQHVPSLQERARQVRGTRGKSAVITGASSGIGRLAAIELAARGWDVVLASRQQPELKKIAREIEEMTPGTALTVPVDVTDSTQVRSLAHEARERYGSIDVWVNAASVWALGPFDQIPEKDFRQVIETDLLGYTNGARAALEHFRDQGHGTLINVSSLAGTVGQPYATPYTAAKAGVTAFSEALRAELSSEPNINVCTIYPGSVDTPFFQHAADFMGTEVKPVPPVYPASDVARAIVSCAEKPKPEVWVGMGPRQVRMMKAIMPKRMESRAMERTYRKGHFSTSSTEPHHGNLFEPDQRYNSVSGGWPQTAGGTRGRAIAIIAVLLGFGAVVALAVWLVQRRNPSLIGRVGAQARQRFEQIGGDRLVTRLRREVVQPAEERLEETEEALRKGTRRAARRFERA